MHQVRHGVIAGDRGAAFSVNAHGEDIADMHGTLVNVAAVAEHGGLDRHRIENLSDRGGVFSHTLITHLTTHFGVARSLIKHENRIIAGFSGRHIGAVLINREDAAAFSAELLITAEFVRRAVVDQTGGNLELASGTGLRTLLFHRTVESVRIHLDALFAADVSSKVSREAEGIMELEHHVAVEYAIRRLGDSVFENLHAVREREEETLFLGLDHLSDVRLIELGVHITHFTGERFNERIEERSAGTELVAVADGAAADTAQHISAAFIARQHAVSNSERACADVVSNHLERRRTGFHVRGTGLLDSGLGGSHQIAEQINVVIRRNVLNHGRDTLETHARIDVRMRQAVHLAGGIAVELGEHKVPDFQITVAILILAPRRTALNRRTAVKEDLGAGTAGARVAHHPEVIGHVLAALVIADTDDSFSGDADFLVPDVVGLVIINVNRHPQTVFRQLKNLRQEFPGPRNRVLLEIVAEAEVAQHFKERVMTRGVADVIQVVMLAAGADALLAGRRAGVLALLDTEVAVLELVHASIREQQRRVILRYYGAGGNNRMSLALKELEISVSYLRGSHVFH
ncbi:uncharacterized protein BN620_00478 [Sutterella sp. CAG:351]|nr:uncharacterized protein BN620_00478 [Sutterella sp. CAG:351]